MLTISFNIFYESLLYKYDDIIDTIRADGFKKIIVDTSGSNDIIKLNNNGYVFLKSKFINNIKLKRQLIEYYNSIGIFIKGPYAVDKNIWIFTLHELNVNSSDNVNRF